MLPLIVLALAVCGGTLTTYFYPEDEGEAAISALARLAAGAVLGLVVFGLVGLTLALVFGLTRTVVAVALLATVAPGLLALRDPARAERLVADLRQLPGTLAQHRGPTLAVTLMAVGLVVLFSGALYEGPYGIDSADLHNLGDLPFHIGIVEGFVSGGNLPPEHPELAGARLTYPFLVDWVAAMLVRSGASLQLAFLAENVVLVLALLGLLVFWALRLTRDTAVATLVPPLVFLSGGLGFWRYFLDAYTTERGLLPLLADLPRDYTILNHGGDSPLGALRWGNALMTLLIPQRGLLFGLPLVLIVWVLLWTVCRGDDDPARRARRLTLAGGLAGLLPLVHLHSFAVLVAVAACLALLFPDRRAWPRFFAAAAVIGLPQIFWLFSGTSLSAGSFVGLAIGWDRNGDNPLWFWIHNTGLVLPALFVALLWRGTPLLPPHVARFLTPWAGCFIVPNLLRLSPWIWDNVKFLIYAYVAATPILALLVVWLWRRHRLWGRASAALVLVSLTLAGALDVTRVASRCAAQRIFDAPAVACARLIRRETPPRALVLHAPTYNHPVLLAGRRSLLGYTGHIFSQGLDAGTREREIQEVFRGVPQGLDRLRAWGVTFVVVGPLEQGLGVHPRFLALLTPVGETDGYRLYRVPER